MDEQADDSRDVAVGKPGGEPGGSTGGSTINEPWRRYRNIGRAGVAIILGRAGRGDSSYSLEAGIVGLYLSALLTNSVLLAVFEATRRAAWLGFLITIVAVWNNRQGIYALRPARRGRGDGIKVMSWNVEYRNKPENVAVGIKSVNADIVLLFEPVSAQLDFARKAGNWKIVHEVPGDGDERHSGIAAYGNELVKEIEWHDLGGMSALRCVVQQKGRQPVAVWAYRPEAPTDEVRRERWVRQLKALEKALVGEKLPICLVGDLNSCVWHQPFSDVIAEGDLRRASPMWGGTWRHEILGWRGRIDHIYTSPTVGRKKSRRDEAWGSDHRALSCTIIPPEDKSAEKSEKIF